MCFCWTFYFEWREKTKVSTRKDSHVANCMETTVGTVRRKGANCNFHHSTTCSGKL